MEVNNRPLVSVVTPCYNGALFLDAYFESILNQTYDNFEVIIVNDGSKDNSDEIIKKYIELCKQKNIKVVYISKENQGQMKAVQDGILATNGDYLTWPDVDDYMEPTYLEDKINVFVNNPDVDILINPVNIYDFEDKENIKGKGWSKKVNSRKELLYRFIEDKDAGYMPGAFMLKMKAFLEVYPDKKFYCEIKAGVAIPLVFPFIYKYNFHYIGVPLYRYYAHINNQHSVNEERDLNNLEVLYLNVIDDMVLTSSEKEELIQRVKNRCLQLKLGYAYRNCKKEEFYNIKHQLKARGAFRLKDFIKEIVMNIKSSI